jgi:tRNA nucleotidyltransferase (CCA-adding enzyme)
MQIYLVGGAVRDGLLGVPAGDRDYVVVGATPEAMIAQGYKAVGADFPVFIHPQSGEEYALARTERKSAPGYRGFVVHAAPDVTLEQDLLRRDFTINAIAQNSDGEIVDPLNGQRDIQHKVLRHCSQAFVEDPLRVLRAARFMARFAEHGFRVADETMQLMREMVHSGEIDHLVPERVFQELRRALQSTQPSAFLQTLRQCDALKIILPEVDALYGVEQRAEFHPEIDAGIHTEMVCDMAARIAPGNSRVGYAALMHDLGKGLTPREEWPKHLMHEHTGLEPVRAVSKRLKVPNDYAELAKIACREHLNIHRLDEMRADSVVELIQRNDGFRHPERIRELALVCEADKRGRLGLQESDYPSARLLRTLHDAALNVNSCDVITPDMTPEKIGEAMHKARVRAVADAKKLFH